MTQSSTGDKLDTTWRVETPEGVDLVLHLCGPLPRLAAWVVDASIRGVVLGIGAILLSIFGATGFGLVLVLAFGLEWLYPVFFELLNDGKTPGKSALGIKAICHDGTPINMNASVIRNLLRAADFLPLMYVSGLVSMLWSPQFRRLGDLAAGTLVVYTRRPEQTTEVPKLLPIPPPHSLKLDEQRALVSFAQRAGTLSTARREELAAIVRPILRTKPANTKQLLAQLHGIAAWLLGRRPTG